MNEPSSWPPWVERWVLPYVDIPALLPVLIAVIRALAATWSDDSRASSVLAAAARSKDHELRQAVYHGTS